MMVYLLPQRLDKAVFVATSVVFFGAMNYAKIVPYLWLGLFDARNLASSLLLIPIGVAGTYLACGCRRALTPAGFTAWFTRCCS